MFQVHVSYHCGRLHAPCLVKPASTRSCSGLLCGSALMCSTLVNLPSPAQAAPPCLPTSGMRALKGFLSLCYKLGALALPSSLRQPAPPCPPMWSMTASWACWRPDC